MLTIVHHEGCRAPYFTSVAESPLRISTIYNKLKNRYPAVSPLPATKEDVLRVHTPNLLAKVQQEGMDIYETALLAAGGAVCAAQLAFSDLPSFAIVRPPGHHAGKDRYGGFCFFNNVAIALTSLLHEGHIERAVVVDIDMHQGDGTQDIFSDEGSISIIDIRANDRELYLDLLRRELKRIPHVDVVAVSAGFDLYIRDWGGLLETSDFHQIGYMLHRTAREKAGGRCFSVLEGGYFLDELGKNVLAFCQGLEGIKPFL
jgi:acetoin utilization deacetylase AcuC-like enzyme